MQIHNNNNNYKLIWKVQDGHVIQNRGLKISMIKTKYLGSHITHLNSFTQSQTQASAYSPANKDTGVRYNRTPPYWKNTDCGERNEYYMINYYHLSIHYGEHQCKKNTS